MRVIHRYDGPARDCCGGCGSKVHAGAAVIVGHTWQHDHSGFRARCVYHLRCTPAQWEEN